MRVCTPAAALWNLESTTAPAFRSSPQKYARLLFLPDGGAQCSNLAQRSACRSGSQVQREKRTYDKIKFLKIKKRSLWWIIFNCAEGTSNLIEYITVFSRL